MTFYFFSFKIIIKSHKCCNKNIINNLPYCSLLHLVLFSKYIENLNEKYRNNISDKNLIRKKK